MIKNVIAELKISLFSDDSPSVFKDNARIMKTYSNADEATKKIIDDIFISICGYSLATLIANANYCGKDRQR